LRIDEEGKQKKWKMEKNGKKWKKWKKWKKKKEQKNKKRAKKWKIGKKKRQTDVREGCCSSSSSFQMITTVLIPSKNNSYQVGCRNCLFVSCLAAAAGHFIVWFVWQRKKVPLSPTSKVENLFSHQKAQEN
jgi:hypothetical protein